MALFSPGLVWLGDATFPTLQTGFLTSHLPHGLLNPAPLPRLFSGLVLIKFLIATLTKLSGSKLPGVVG